MSNTRDWAHLTVDKKTEYLNDLKENPLVPFTAMPDKLIVFAY